MQKIFVIYNLLPGVTKEQFAAWSSEIDQRITPRRDGCIRYEVYQIEGAPSGEPFCQVMEDIEVESVDRFMASLKDPEMAYVMSTFKNYVDESTVKFAFGSKINPALLPVGSTPPLPGTGDPAC